MTCYEFEVSFPDEATTKGFAEYMGKETGNEPEVFEGSLSVRIVIYKHGDRLLLLDFVEEHGGVILSEDDIGND